MRICKARWICLIAAGVCLARFALAGTIRHDRADSLYTDLAAQEEYAGVGRVDVTTADGDGVFGSGTLISGNRVLTAAHVVEDAAAGGGYTLASGDGVLKETPFESIRLLVELAERYGRYR